MRAVGAKALAVAKVAQEVSDNAKFFLTSLHANDFRGSHIPFSLVPRTIHETLNKHLIRYPPFFIKNSHLAPPTITELDERQCSFSDRLFSGRGLGVIGQRISRDVCWTNVNVLNALRKEEGEEERGRSSLKRDAPVVGSNASTLNNLHFPDLDDGDQNCGNKSVEEETDTNNAVRIYSTNSSDDGENGNRTREEEEKEA